MNSNRWIRVSSLLFNRPRHRSEYALLPCLSSKKNGKEDREAEAGQTFIVPDASDLDLSPRFPISFPPISWEIAQSEFPVSQSSASQRLFSLAVSLRKQSAFGPHLSPHSSLLFHLLRESSFLSLFEKLYLHPSISKREYREILASSPEGRGFICWRKTIARSCRWPSNTVTQLPIIKLAGCYIVNTALPRHFTTLSFPFQYPRRLLIRGRVILRVAERVKGRID